MTQEQEQEQAQAQEQQEQEQEQEKEQEQKVLDGMLRGTSEDADYCKLLLIRKGRSYRIGPRKTLTLQLFSTTESDVIRLKRVYGGNYHAHRSGYQWTVAKRLTLQAIYNDVLANYKTTVPPPLRTFANAFTHTVNLTAIIHLAQLNSLVGLADGNVQQAASTEDELLVA